MNFTTNFIKCLILKHELSRVSFPLSFALSLVLCMRANTHAQVYNCAYVCLFFVGMVLRIHFLQTEIVVQKEGENSGAFSSK